LGYLITGYKNAGLSTLGDLKFSIAYTGAAVIDGDNLFDPGFTHMAVGEVLNLEPYNGPFWYIKADYKLPLEMKTELSVLYAQQDSNTLDNASELDIVARIPIYEGLRLYLLYSQVSTDVLSEPIDYFGVEIRWTY